MMKIRLQKGVRKVEWSFRLFKFPQKIPLGMDLSWTNSSSIASMYWLLDPLALEKQALLRNCRMID